MTTSPGTRARQGEIAAACAGFALREAGRRSVEARAREAFRARPDPRDSATRRAPRAEMSTRPVAGGSTTQEGGVRQGRRGRAARVGLAWRHSPKPYRLSLWDAAFPTIVEYTEREPPCNEYPVRIVSPPRAGACCAWHMVSVGAAQKDKRCIVQYRRCTTCGFTVRRILREIQDEAALQLLRVALASAFTRKDGEP